MINASPRGIDISQHCVTQSRRIVASKKIADKVEVIQLDAVNLSIANKDFLARSIDQQGVFDACVCTYFTAGDFKPEQILLDTGDDGRIVDYSNGALSPNKDFVAVFRGAFDMLRDGGKIVLGSIYCDNHLARNVQEEFYRRCGMTVITSKKDPFTATKEGFWSERFNEEKIRNYLWWIDSRKIEFVPLDDYNFAVMVVISK